MQDYKALFETKDFDGAIKALKTDKSIELPIKYFNLGYAYYQKGELSLSRYYFEKASNIGFLNEQNLSALSKVKQDLGVEQIEANYGALDKALLASTGFQQDVYLSVGALFVVLGFIAFLKSKKIIGSLMMILFMIFMGTLFYFKDMKTVILLKEAYVHEGPSRIFEPNQQLERGMKVILGKEIKNWKWIRYPKEFRGWLYKPEVKNL